MKFGKIDNIIIFGGSYISIKFLEFLKVKNFKFNFFTSKRLLSDNMPNNLTLKQNLDKLKIKYTVTNDINNNKKIYNSFNKKSLVLGFGYNWKIKEKLLRLFKNKMVDFMGIPMPTYRGGAHYSWMILNMSKNGGCYIQDVNKNTTQGISDSGYYYDNLKYLYPKKLKIPKDFFYFSIKKELFFLKKFLKKINQNRNFKLKKLNNSYSIYFPRLKTLKNGFIDWNLEGEEIFRFINAFDDPYRGASTFLGKKRIFLKNCYFKKKKGIHSFASGIIINKYKKFIYIAVKNGIIKTNNITDDKGKFLFEGIMVGDRFVTFKKNLENSKYF